MYEGTEVYEVASCDGALNDPEFWCDSRDSFSVAIWAKTFDANDLTDYLNSDRYGTWDRNCTAFKEKEEESSESDIEEPEEPVEVCDPIFYDYQCEFTECAEDEVREGNPDCWKELCVNDCGA